MKTLANWMEKWEAQLVATQNRKQSTQMMKLRERASKDSNLSASPFALPPAVIFKTTLVRDSQGTCVEHAPQFLLS